MRYRIFPVLALVALAVALVLLSSQNRGMVAPVAVQGPPPEPGYAARQAELIQTGADGRPLYTLNADIIQQLPEQDTVQLQRVHLAFRDVSGNEWTARAEHGELGQSTGKVSLSGDVHVAGILPGTQAPAEIATQALSLDTQAQIVDTDQPVTLTWSGRNLSAQGLFASLKERRVRLQSAVHGTFAP
jgi:LPS export ABC transporter protein LptC